MSIVRVTSVTKMAFSGNINKIKGTTSNSGNTSNLFAFSKFPSTRNSEELRGSIVLSISIYI